MKSVFVTLVPFSLFTYAYHENFSHSDSPRCTYDSSCWPSPSTWTTFNDSISGYLIASFPSAAVCHNKHYDAALCANATAEWDNSFWRTSQIGAYSAVLWELGDGQCFVNTSIDAPCDQGRVPWYSVAAQGAADIEAAVKFADEHNLYLVVKNTGHDHLGRSSGEGSFAIWTHNLKGREWHDAFIPKGAPNGTAGIPAVTLQAGEQWLDVYQDAAKHGVIVVGGSARTVGAAGGWLTGGGHSAWSHFYGLGVDNLLEATIITPSGNHITLNAYNDPEYFWAVRGGGGNSWGVLTSVTYCTHPEPTHIQVVFAQLNTTDPTIWRQILKTMFQTLPAITDAGYTGYGTTDGGLGLIFIQPNGTNETLTSIFAPLYELAALPNVSAQVGSMEFPSWLDYTTVFLQDPNIATNVQDASRLLTAEVLREKADELVDLVLECPEAGAGFNFIGKVDATYRNQTSVHPVWAESRAVFSLGVDWADDAPEQEKTRKKKQLVDISNKLGIIAGEGQGTYFNEANPYEPDWEEVFWGQNYECLLRIKRRIDKKSLFVCNRCVGSDIVLKP